jgi:hypothetical protein
VYTATASILCASEVKSQFSADGAELAASGEGLAAVSKKLSLICTLS